MITFPSIGQFRQTIRAVSQKVAFIGMDETGEPIYDGLKPKPNALNCRGTVKCHGTNSALVRTPDGQLIPQSRNRELTLEDDSYGFARFALETIGSEAWNKVFETISKDLDLPIYDRSIVLYGEWCGGNIQPNVALTQLDKMFIIFALAVVYKGQTTWLDMAKLKHLPELEDLKVFNILNAKFPHYNITIDFNNPALVQNDLVKITEAVEKECPVGKAFGVSGIGEGVVWTCIDPDWMSDDYWFKCKGSEHSVSKVKTLASVDVEKLSSCKAFAEYAITELRCLQAIAALKEQKKPIDQTSTADVIRWLYNDVVKEEADTILASGLTDKEVGKALGSNARTWYFKYLQGLAGLK